MWRCMTGMDFDRLRKKEIKRLQEILPKEIYQRDFQGALWILRRNHNALVE